MSYQVLARKWRPKTFAEMVGQTQALQGLIHALDQGRLHHAYLFTGTRGVGKTSIARILAKCLNCEKGVSSTPCGECDSCREIAEGRFADLIEIDAASRTKVEDTREILDNVQYAPTRGRYKIYLIDEVHMLSGHSFNALLKTLEEPPPHVKFLLATTDPQKLPVTVLSRCLQFNLKNISAEDIAKHLQEILTQEAIPFEAAALSLVGRAASGSLRDALSLLDQAIAYGQGQVLTEQTAKMLGTIDHQELYNIVTALQQQDGKALMACAHSLSERGADFSNALAGLARLFYLMALIQIIADADCEEFNAEQVKALSQGFAAEQLQVLYQIATLGRRDLGLAPDPKVGFEMTLLRLLAFRPLAQGAQAIEAKPALTKALTPVKPAVPSAASSDAKPLDVRAKLAEFKPSPKPASPTITPPVQMAVVEQVVIDKPVVNVEPVAIATPDISEQVSAKIQDVQDWASLLQQLELSGMAKQFALNCVLSDINERLLTLTVEEQHAKMFNERIKMQIETALQKHFDSKIALQIVIGKSEQETPAATDKRIAADKMQAAEQALINDKNVHFIQNQFNAIIDKNSIKPRQ